jgi:hypothetical protein
MDSPTAGERGVAPSPRDPSDQAIDFVRFCHRRRRVGWPELYDEMCSVASRRLYEGWGMFAPDVPTRDLWVVVDAVTIDGRHVDPWNELASRVHDPSLRSIPARLDQDAAYCDYTVALPDNDIYHEPFGDWIMSYHRRTRRPENRIKHFDAYVVEQDNALPGQREPSNVQARVFLHR